jgi:TM2 domain-containing membrane protein YozV
MIKCPECSKDVSERALACPSCGCPIAATSAKLEGQTSNATLAQSAEKANTGGFYPTFFLCLFLGMFGVHRFFNKKYKTGAVQLVTFGGLGIWALIDLVMILFGKFKDANGVPIRNISPKVSGAVTVLAVLIGIGARSGNTVTSSSDDSDSPSVASNVSGFDSLRSNDTILTEYAKARHGKDAHVEVQRGFYGGGYQVIVRARIAKGQYAGGYDRFSYKATVDPVSHTVTSFDMYDHN